ncbi:MAG: MFS transporter [Bacteroidales bacterium]|nr:MFS transporter [Bacteroidales bacterium]
MRNNKNGNMSVVGAMYLLYFMIAFVTNFAGSMGIVLKSQFATTNAMAQLGTFANFIAYACMGIPAGIILRHKGYKFTALSAIGVGFVGLMIQMMSGMMANFAIYVIGALVAGVSMAMLNTVVNPMLNTIGGGGNRGNQLIQWAGACNSTGGTLAPIILGYLIGTSVEHATVSDTYPALWIAMAIFIVAFVIIFFTRIPEPHLGSKTSTSNSRLDSPLRHKHFVLGAIGIFFYVGIEVGIPNTANLYMTSTNDGLALSAQTAGWMVGLYWILMLAGRFVGALLGKRVSSRAMLMASSAAALLLVLTFMLLPTSISFSVGSTSMPLRIAAIVAVGLFTSVMWGAIFNLSTEGLGDSTPMASGMFMTLVCGGGIITLLQNHMADQWGYVASYAITAAGLLYLLFYALSGSKPHSLNS